MLGKLAPLRLRKKNIITRLAPLGKYLGLAVALYFYFALGQPRSDIPIRIGEFFQSVALTFEHAGLLWMIRTCFVLGFSLWGWLRPTHGAALPALREASLMF